MTNPPTKAAGGYGSTATERGAIYADEAGGPFHHVIFSQGGGWLRDGRVHVGSHWNGNLRAYGALIPGTCLVLPEDELIADNRGVPLDDSIRPLLLRGFSTRNLRRRSWAYLRARSTIRRIVSESSFVQCQYVSSFGVIAGMAAIAAGKPFYLDLGGSLREPPDAENPLPWHKRFSYRFYLAKERKLARSLKLLISVSPRLHQLFPPTSAPRIVVTHSMIEAKDIFRRRTACTKETVTILFAGRMIERKGLSFLLRAVGTLTDQSFKVQLRMAGSGQQESELRRLALELGLAANVEFLGSMPAGARLWEQYRDADIVVLPAILPEGTPRTIIEAWAAGAAVVATAVSGIADLVRDREDGLLIPPRDVQAIADAVRRLRTDAELRGRLVENGYRRVAAMTFEGRIELLREAFTRYLPGLLIEGRSGVDG